MRSVARGARTALALLLSACGPDVVGTPITGYHEHRVTPSVTSNAIAGFNDDHIVWAPAARNDRGGTLVVLLTGTNGKPEYSLEIGRLAVNEGFHVVSLMYPNDIAVVTTCAGDPDPDCMRAMRAEIVTGSATSSHVTVDRANSIEGRLEALLAFLIQHLPDEGWDRYLTNAGPTWSAIVVAGLSQGGGHAAYIGTIQFVHRVAMFGAPADGTGGEAAPWMRTGETPAWRWYGFAHRRDPFTSIGANWLALGLDAFGPEQRVDQVPFPYADSHMLRTDLLPSTGTYDDAHTSVFLDFSTPRLTDGSPVYGAVWRYMLGPSLLGISDRQGRVPSARFDSSATR